MTLAGVYGFWKYVSKLERLETRRYLEMFYILKFRDLVSNTSYNHIRDQKFISLIIIMHALFQVKTVPPASDDPH